MKPSQRPRRLLPLAALLLTASCASVDFQRDSATSGTFTSKGYAFTIASIDLPKPAEHIARENASDAGLPHLVIEEVKVVPYLGHVDWLLDILSIRYVRITGRWGFDGEDPGAPPIR